MKHSRKQRWLGILFSVRKNKDSAGIACKLTFFFGYSILSFQIRFKIFQPRFIWNSLFLDVQAGRSEDVGILVCIAEKIE